MRWGVGTYLAVTCVVSSAHPSSAPSGHLLPQGEKGWLGKRYGKNFYSARLIEMPFMASVDCCGGWPEAL